MRAQLNGKDADRRKDGRQSKRRTCSELKQKAVKTPTVLTAFCFLPTAFSSSPRLEDAVEGRLGGASELCEAALRDDFAEHGLGCDRAERGAVLRERVGRAAERGGGGERP